MCELWLLKVRLILPLSLHLTGGWVKTHPHFFINHGDNMMKHTLKVAAAPDAGDFRR